MTDLSCFDDKELQEELNRRAIIRRREMVEARVEKNKLFIEHKDVILKFLSHSRTSCNDENTANGYENSQGTYKCNRCAFLLFGPLDTDEIDIDMHITMKKDLT